MSRSVHVREVSAHRCMPRYSNPEPVYFIVFTKRIPAGDKLDPQYQHRHFLLSSDSVDLDDVTGTGWYDVIGELAIRLGDWYHGTRFALVRAHIDDDGSVDPCLCRGVFRPDGYLDDEYEMERFDGYRSFESVYQHYPQ